MLRSKHLLVGLPSTGKTTFLAAFWHVVESDEVPNSLRLRRLEGDRSYIERVRDSWLRFKRVPRTGPTTQVSILLANPVDSADVELIFPDISGEIFREHWTDRVWMRDFANSVAVADGLLLFLHPDEIDEPRSVKEVTSLAAVLGDNEGHLEPEEFPEWRPEHAPTQVKNVELLQFLADAMPRRPIRVAVIISAWDIAQRTVERVQTEAAAPDEWLKVHLPQLCQYLRANPETFKTRVFGLSAQGGDFESEDDAERMRRQARPSDRILVVAGDERTSDITAPVRWLMA